MLKNVQAASQRFVGEKVVWKDIRVSCSPFEKTGWSGDKKIEAKRVFLRNRCDRDHSHSLHPSIILALLSSSD